MHTENFGQWIQEWWAPGTTGDLISWSITAVMALYAYFSRRAGKRREQALQVTAWIDHRSDGRIVARARNSSRDRIEAVGLMVAPVHENLEFSDEAGSEAQFFTVPAIGPERSVEFLLGFGVQLAGDLRIRLYFSDHQTRSWTLFESGRLKRGQRLSKAFFSGLNLGSPARVTNHENSLDEEDRKETLPDLDITRLDIDPSDGTNIIMTFLPKEGEFKVSTFAELKREDGKKARISLDDGDHLLSLKICLLPTDIKNYCFPHYVKTDSKVLVLFGAASEPEDAVFAHMEEMSDAFQLGGMNTPWPELGAIAYNDIGRPVCIAIERTALHPAFLTD
ncbi:hypothetical protein [Allobranchiibius sp. GilTou73]|uniref:hypothetical protein n=1 Tax=Allobranchiibius sp. GilTou73 TaxID=2904523 RepID=UPI001F44FA19|nr:hypothetical protein [Allobranchiibius sp. GilTou73]UIJ35131.1 hypothetical protein LVQ62_01595 [Allobranchiibius sp. GilTou73]